MGTRGFVGTRNNKKLIEGIFNSHDSYYEGLGEEIVDLYFGGTDILGAVEEYGNEDKDFLQDGLYCEYAYVWNEENDTLEIYRGFFKVKQSFIIKEQIINSLDEGKRDSGVDNFYCHLVMIIDKKKHKQKDVLKAFEVYSNKRNEDDVKGYPEREIIPLEVNKDYKLIV